MARKRREPLKLGQDRSGMARKPEIADVGALAIIDRFTGNGKEAKGIVFLGVAGTGKLYRVVKHPENCTARAPKLHSACCMGQWRLHRQIPL